METYDFKIMRCQRLCCRALIYTRGIHHHYQHRELTILFFLQYITLYIIFKVPVQSKSDETVSTKNYNFIKFQYCFLLVASFGQKTLY